MSECTPGTRSVSWYGDSQDSNGSASRAHSKVISGPYAEKVNTAVVSVDGLDGFEWIVVSGAPETG
jgi:hypothetical protein